MDAYTARMAARGAGRRAIRLLVGQLPPAVTEPLRAGGKPSRRGPATAAHRKLIRLLRHGGIPRSAHTFALKDNPRLTFVNADSLVLHQLYWFGEQGYEPELIPWWRYLCGRSSSILEIGANVGYYTVQGACAAPEARYVAVEPHPAAVQTCADNLALNGIESVELIRAAAVAEPHDSSVQLLVPQKEHFAAPVGAFVSGSSEIPAKLSHHITGAIDTPAVAVGDLLDGVDLMKLDVEGLEYGLLSAAADYIAARRPTIVVEVLRGTPKLRALLTSFCLNNGYRCYVPSSTGLHLLDPVWINHAVLQEEFHTRDLILSAVDLPANAQG
jgi:FkbM family methyltransferase